MFFRSRKKAAAEQARIVSLCSRDLQYVTLRDCTDNTETVIGKSGAINFKEDQIMILCDGVLVFSKPVSELIIGELLSKNGVTFTYHDPSGKRMTVIAYYSYYRKSE